MTAPVGPGLPDAATRELAQREFERPIAVEAGAGTGKTALLVARVAAWCLGPGWDRHAVERATAEDTARAVLDAVVAITFTEAAASEMASKVGRGFARIAAGGSLEGWAPDPETLPERVEELAGRATALADEIGRLRVHTIHAFCQRLLREAPLEAGVHPRFEVDGDGSRVEEAVAEVVEEVLRTGEAAGSEDWRRLAEAGVGPTAVAEATVAALNAGARPVDLASDPFPDDRARAWAERLDRALTEFRTVERGRFHGLSKAPNAIKAVEAVDRVAAGFRSTEPERQDFASLSSICGELDDSSWRRLCGWAKGDLAVSEAAVLETDVDDLVAAAARLTEVVEPLRSLRVAELGAARRVVGGVLETARERLRRRGVVTYQDLLVNAADLLERAPAVRREFRSGMDQLMVDEFQDTDRVQCRLVELLALQDDGGSRPGLFVVGDPKQSIYGWRRADLAAYHDFMTLLVGRGGTCAPLTANFRSHQPILDEVARVVEPVMRFEHGLQPAYQPLIATGERDGSAGFDRSPWSAVEHWACWPRNPDTGAPERSRRGHRAEQQLEAEAVAADIRRVHDEGGVPWGEIAVLLRTTTQQSGLLEAMQRLDVPFDVAREREYYRQREVVEAAGLVRCVLEPEDALALLTVVRSDMVGVPDGVLAGLWDAGFAARMAALDGRDDGALNRALACVAAVAADAGKNTPGVAELPRWHDALAAAVSAIDRLRRIEREASPDRFVTRVRDLMQPELTASARYLGGVRRARLERFFVELEQVMERHASSPAAVARFLKRAVDEARESQLPPEPETETDAVRVMTIHHAKGLDFGHVYMVQTHRGTGGRALRPSVEVFDGGREYTLFGWPTPGVTECRARSERRAALESVRLLYVALTRAKERLVVSGAWSRPGGEPAAGTGSSLGDLVAHRRDDAAMRAQASERDARALDENADHVQWVFPALWSSDAAPPVVDGRDRVGDPSLAALARDAELLADARIEAGRRSARPIAGRMSDEAHRLFETADVEAELPDAGVPHPSVGAAVGTAVHALLEELELDRPLGAQVAAHRDALVARIVRDAEPGHRDEVRSRLGDFLDRLVDSDCLRRLEALAPSVLAREMPLLAPAGDGETAVTVVAGAVDLLYRDDDGSLVIGDYKTDAVADDVALATRVERYRPQLEAYADAVVASFDLDAPPRRELWFLDADQIVTLD